MPPHRRPAAYPARGRRAVLASVGRWLRAARGVELAGASPVPRAGGDAVTGARIAAAIASLEDAVADAVAVGAGESPIDAARAELHAAIMAAIDEARGAAVTP